MFKKGEGFIDRVGEIHKNKAGEQFVIINYRRSSDLDVKFEDGTVVTNRRYKEVVTGQIKNLNSPSIFGVGYLGYGKHTAYIDGNRTKKDRYWRGMFRRCYSETELVKHPTYKYVVVGSEWCNFQVFSEWFYESYNSKVMVDWHLDKDILIKGNKVYSPKTCCFVPAEINQLFVKCDKSRGDLPIGVFRSGDKYRVAVRKGKGLRVYLGTFDTIEGAFKAYKSTKEKHIKEVAEKYKNQITEQTYRALINYQVEITD